MDLNAWSNQRYRRGSVNLSLHITKGVIDSHDVIWIAVRYMPNKARPKLTTTKNRISNQRQIQKKLVNDGGRPIFHLFFFLELICSNFC